MPQFDIANFVPQLAWLALFFTILYFGVVRMTLPRLGNTMQARDDKVSDDLASAEMAKIESDRVSAAYHAELEKAHVDARAALAASKTLAQGKIEARLKAADAAIATSQATAQSTLDEATAKAVAEVETIAADAAADIVERLTGKRPAAGKAGTAVKSAMAAG